MTLLSKKIIISGKVQGVGYRVWLKNFCNKNKITGWVLNKNNGDVEATFCDIEDEIFKDLLSNCFMGPPNAKVTNICIKTLLNYKSPSTFKIVEE